MPQWCNWSGSLRFTPRAVMRPRSEEALTALLARATQQGRGVRPVGSGHSSSPLVRSEDVLVSLEHLSGIVAVDQSAREATLWAGTRLHAAGRALERHGLAFENLGDVDTQALAGALLTGTHGSGLKLGNLASNMVGARLVTADGFAREVTGAADPELLRALRVSLGALGILSQVRIKLVESSPLRRRDYCSSTADCLTHLDELAARHRNLDFYWYPRRDDVKIRGLNPADQDPVALPFAQLVHEEVGTPASVIARERTLKFEEMEYFFPRENARACFLALRKRMIDRHRKDVAWRVLFRFVAGDDAMLSPTARRDSVTLSIHHNAGLPYQEFFADIEPLFRAHGGRPHWGKRHSMTTDELAPLYPELASFMRWRARLDPERRFWSVDLARLLGAPEGES